MLQLGSICVCLNRHLYQIFLGKDTELQYLRYIRAVSLMFGDAASIVGT